MGEPVQRFEENLRKWHRKEQSAFRDRYDAGSLDRTAVTSIQAAAKDCLAAQFPGRADNDEAPLFTLHKIARKQRTQLHQALELVRTHATLHDDSKQLLTQLPAEGAPARKMAGIDVVATLAEVLDLASKRLIERRREKANEANSDDEKEAKSKKEHKSGKEKEHKDGKDSKEKKDKGKKDADRERRSRSRKRRRRESTDGKRKDKSRDRRGGRDKSNDEKEKEKHKDKSRDRSKKEKDE